MSHEPHYRTCARHNQMFFDDGCPACTVDLEEHRSLDRAVEPPKAKKPLARRLYRGLLALWMGGTMASLLLARTPESLERVLERSTLEFVFLLMGGVAWMLSEML